MDFEQTEKEETGKLTAPEVQQIYKKHGKTISLQQAELILVFARRLANIAVAQCLRNEAGSDFQENNNN
jgi:hypothetical protein